MKRVVQLPLSKLPEHFLSYISFEGPDGYYLILRYPFLAFF